jgi:rhodanese-related sulfurtransferase
VAQAIQKAFIIVLLGSALGLLSNAISPKGIPLITPPKKAPKAEEFVPLEKAYDLWSSGATFFLDARNPEDYHAGHIANALNLPGDQFAAHFPQVAGMLSPETALVIYCDGIECELSHRLADQLRSSGYTNIHMLHNGWTAWRTAGFPVEPALVQ